MRGKYSPTVSEAYRRNKDWWHNFSDLGSNFDKEGYDSYGYNQVAIDRAGNFEEEYYLSDLEDEDINFAYDQACRDWGFDGVKPVKKA